MNRGIYTSINHTRIIKSTDPHLELVDLDENTEVSGGYFFSRSITMNNTLVVIAFILLATIIPNALATEKNYSLVLTNPDKPASIEVEVRKGSVTVIGYEGETVEIKAIISEPPPPPDSLNQKHTKRKDKVKSTARSSAGLKTISGHVIRLEIEEYNNVVKVSSKVPTQYVDLIIKIPQYSKLTVSLFTGGDITVDSVLGIINLDAFEGAIYAENISGPIIAKTRTTDIVVHFSDFNKDSPSQLISHRGNVDVTLTDNISAYVIVKNYKGQVFSGLDQDFISLEQIHETDEDNKQKITIGGTMRAVLNDGGQVLSLKSYSGNLYVRKANP